MLNILRSNKGFIFIEVLFLTLILSFTVMMVFNALESAIKSNRMSAIRIAAIHIANAHMAEIEEYVDSNKSFPESSYTLLSDDDLIREDFFGISGIVKFNVNTQIHENINKGNVTIKVSWTINNNSNYGNSNNYEEISKDIFIITATSRPNTLP